MTALALVKDVEMPTTAAPHVDTILRTSVAGVQYQGELKILADGAKQIRDLFRSLGWSRYFRVTKRCWSLGPSIEWAKGYKPEWYCDRIQAQRAERSTSPRWFEIGICHCPTCKHREAQQRAISRRVAYVLNLAFHKEATRPIGDHSDSTTDYFDADYTFHPWS
jgi:hypothetical protein